MPTLLLLANASVQLSKYFAFHSIISARSKWPNHHCICVDLLRPFCQKKYKIVFLKGYKNINSWIPVNLARPDDVPVPRGRFREGRTVPAAADLAPICPGAPYHCPPAANNCLAISTSFATRFRHVDAATAVAEEAAAPAGNRPASLAAATRYFTALPFISIAMRFPPPSPLLQSSAGQK